MSSEDEKLVGYFKESDDSERDSEEEDILLKKRNTAKAEPVKSQTPNSEDEDEQLVPDLKQRSKVKSQSKSKNKSAKRRKESSESEADSESSEGSDDVKPKKYTLKKRRLEAINQYIDDRAIESSEEEEDDDPEERELRRKQYLDKKHDFAAKIKNLEQRAEYYDEHDEDAAREYIDQSEQEREDNEGYPTLKDPRMFSVKCKAGLENEAVVSLLNKYFALKSTDQEIQIISAISVPKIVGYIFVEAMRAHYVKHAVDGILSLRSDIIKLLPLKEVPKVLKADPRKDINVEPNTFIRIKRGLYGGDLGLIQIVDDDTNTAIVRVIPRIENSKDEQKIKPPAKLFDSESYPGAQPLASRNINGRAYSYKNQRFVNGLLEKRFPLDNLDKTNVLPSYEEVKVFRDAEPSDKIKNIIMKTLANSIDESKRLQKSLEKGDKVKVISGDLINLVGVVLEVNEDFVKVDFTDSGYFNEPINFKPSELMKVFEVGQHVEVTVGNYKGVTGTIIKIDENRVHLITEDNKDEVIVLMTEIKQSGIKGYNVAQLKKRNNELQRFDLILMNDNKTAGVVLQVMRNNVTIIDTEGMVNTFSKIQIAQKVTKGYHATNCYGQDIHPKCVVKILKNKNKNTLGTVKHIYNNKVFLYDKSKTEDEGMLVEDLNNCYVLESHMYDNSRTLARFNNPILNRNTPVVETDNNFQNNPLENLNHLKVSLIGQKKKIVRGPWKGYEGIIQSISDKSVKFELSAKNKVISVPFEYINMSAADKNTFINNMDTANKSTLIRHANSPYMNMATPVYNPDL